MLEFKIAFNQLVDRGPLLALAEERRQLSGTELCHTTLQTADGIQEQARLASTSVDESLFIRICIQHPSLRDLLYTKTPVKSPNPRCILEA